MEDWKQYQEMVERNARSELSSSDPDLIEQVCRCLASIDALADEAEEPRMTDGVASKTSIVLLKFLKSDPNEDRPNRLATAFRMLIRGYATRLIADLLGVDLEFVEDLFRRLRGFFDLG